LLLSFYIVFTVIFLLFFISLYYSRTDMRGAAGEAVEIYREPGATKQIGSPLG
jgi:hypothetical protein